jgi:MoxR-like ATPase
MEEQQVTIDGVRYDLGRPFFVIATQNPIEIAGTDPLPEAQLDRFMMKLSVGLPDKEEELAILDRYIYINEDEDPLARLTAIVNKGEIIEMQKGADSVFVHPVIREYLADIVLATRNHNDIVMGASPRASLNLVRAAKVYAALAGREFCLPDDIKALAGPVLAHRLVLSFGYQPGKDSAEKVAAILARVPAPTEDFRISPH